MKRSGWQKGKVVNEPGSEEVSGGGGLGVGLQKVNYVLVGGSLGHLLSCLTILGRKKKTEKNSG